MEALPVCVARVYWKDAKRGVEGKTGMVPAVCVCVGGGGGGGEGGKWGHTPSITFRHLLEGRMW